MDPEQAEHDSLTILSLFLCLFLFFFFFFPRLSFLLEDS